MEKHNFMKPIISRTFAFLIVACLYIMHGCTKVPVSHGTPPIYGGPYSVIDFSFYVYNPSFRQDQLFTGDTIYFKVDVPSTDSFTLKFDDGTISKDSLTWHVYKDTGIFPVTLIVNNDTVNTVSKTVKIIKAPDSTSITHMAGVKFWHGHEYLAGSGSTINVVDTFNVIRVNNATIIIKGDTLRYELTDGNMIYYNCFLGNNAGREFYYYYPGDSLYTIYYFPATGNPDLQSAIYLYAP